MILFFTKSIWKDCSIVGIYLDHHVFDILSGKMALVTKLVPQFPLPNIISRWSHALGTQVQTVILGKSGVRMFCLICLFFPLKSSGKPACWVFSSAFWHEPVGPWDKMGQVEQASEGTTAALCISQHWNCSQQASAVWNPADNSDDGV